MNSTNYLAADTNNVLSQTEQQEPGPLQASEVLRKRVDRFGVAEPVIQPAGNDRILIQLPGLSDADKESARAQIQKAAYLEFRLVHEKGDELVLDGFVEPVIKEMLRHPHKTRGRAGGRRLPRGAARGGRPASLSTRVLFPGTSWDGPKSTSL